jgi:hypothetical protein
MTDDTRPADITTEARRLAEAATPGPWGVAGPADTSSGNYEVFTDNGGLVAEVNVEKEPNGGEPNARLIAWCRTGVPALLERIASLEATNAKLAAFAGTVPSKGDVR